MRRARICIASKKQEVFSTNRQFLGIDHSTARSFDKNNQFLMKISSKTCDGLNYELKNKKQISLAGVVLTSTAQSIP